MINCSRNNNFSHNYTHKKPHFDEKSTNNTFPDKKHHCKKKAQKCMKTILSYNLYEVDLSSTITPLAPLFFSLESINQIFPMMLTFISYLMKSTVHILLIFVMFPLFDFSLLTFLFYHMVNCK